MSRNDASNHSDEEAKGIGLCLSGGGYRAMVFHLGVLWRLNETGVLAKLDRVSSVSGGSITAAVLGMNWTRLEFTDGVATNLADVLVKPVREMASESIDVKAILGGIFSFDSIGEKVSKAYRKHLFGDATLTSLPTDAEGPRFVINASNVQSGALWRFSRPYMGDYLVGRVFEPHTGHVSLADAVAASSAFPPLLSPFALKLDPNDFRPDPGCPLQRRPFTSHAVLTDGGVYDNLGLETVWKRYGTILVSDAGGNLAPEAKPKTDWVRHAIRVLGVIDNQVRGLRKRQLIAAYKNPNDKRDGAFWGIRTSIAEYKLADALPCPKSKALELANTPTRLKALSETRQERLINWGYAICDAALRRYASQYLKQPVTAPEDFPYSGGI